MTTETHAPRSQNGRPKRPISINHVDDETIIVTVRNVAYTMKELDGLRQSQADRMSAGSDSVGIGTMRAMFAITEIDGVAVPKAKGDLQIRNLMQKIPGPVADVLSIQYGTTFSYTDEDLGNLSSDADSQGS